MKPSLLVLGLVLATLPAAGSARNHASQRPSMIRKKVTHHDGAGRPGTRTAPAQRSLS